MDKGKRLQRQLLIYMIIVALLAAAPVSYAAATTETATQESQSITAVGPVTDLTVKKSSNKKKLILKWEKSASIVKKYDIYRKTAVNGKWKHIATVSGRKSSYADTDIKWTHRYYYMVRGQWKSGKTICRTPKSEIVQYVTKNTKARTQTIKWNTGWKYAKRSKIHKDTATLYRAKSKNRNGIIVAINAGHGTNGGESVRTRCHPDGSAKVTGGSTPKGSLTASAVSGGTVLSGGVPESVATLNLAKVVKRQLLAAGYDVLMIREDGDLQLDNIARTVMANNCADCLISIHYDSTSYDKGFFYAGVPKVSSYRKMEPVASVWKQHEKLGKALVRGEKSQNVKIYRNGRTEIDLTQTSYSQIPSVLIEVGDYTSSRSKRTLNKIAGGIVEGLNLYYKCK